MRLRGSLLTLTILVGCAVYLSLAGSEAAKAQDAGLRVIDYRIETNFPKDVKFYVEASGPEDIVEVRVHLRTIGQTSRSAYLQAEFEPGSSISGEAELLTSGNSYVPPGTRLTYHFEIIDNTGRVLLTDNEVFVYLDNRFEWFTVSEGIVTVYYNDPLVKSRAEHVLETALTSMAITGPVLGIDPELPLHIVTYHNYRDMFGALPFRSEATGQQLITQGMAFDKERVLMVHSGDGSVTSTTAHEFVHLLVGDALGRAYSRAPAWLNEGLAEYGSRHGGDRDILNRAVERAIQSDSLRPLWHLGSYSGTPEEIIYAYAHGESVVTFMVLEYGEEKMVELMRALSTTFDIDKALMLVYGFDQHGIDSEWRKAIGLEPLPAPEANRPRPQVTRQPAATVRPVTAPTPVPQAQAATLAPAVKVQPESVQPLQPLQPAQPDEPVPDSARRPTLMPTSVPEPAAIVVEPPPTVAPPAPEPGPSESDSSGGLSPITLIGIALLVLLAVGVGLIVVRPNRNRSGNAG